MSRSVARPTRPASLAGPPLRLPPMLDAVAERWWAATPRTRLLLGLLLVIVVLAAGVGHLAATPYGHPTTVLVAAHDLHPGQRLEAQDLRRRTVPADLVPDGALEAAQGVLASALPAGAIATDRHLGEGGWAAGLADGRAAVAVPSERLPALTAGTRVQLVAADHDGRGVVLGSDAVVLASELEEVWFAVDANDAVAITAAGQAGALAVVVLPP